MVKKGKAKPRRKVGALTKASGKKATSKARKFRAAALKRRAKLAPKSRRKVGTPTKASGKKSDIKLSPKLQRRLDDQNKKAEGLMERGRMRGFVTYDEILKAFPTIESDVMFL